MVPLSDINKRLTMSRPYPYPFSPDVPFTLEEKETSFVSFTSFSLSLLIDHLGKTNDARDENQYYLAKRKSTLNQNIINLVFTLKYLQHYQQAQYGSDKNHNF